MQFAVPITVNVISMGLPEFRLLETHTLRFDESLVGNTDAGWGVEGEGIVLCDCRDTLAGELFGNKMNLQA